MLCQPLSHPQNGGDVLRAAAGLGQEPHAGDESVFWGAEALLGLRPAGGRQERGRVHALQRALSRAVETGHLHHDQTRHVKSLCFYNLLN